MFSIICKGYYLQFEKVIIFNLQTKFSYRDSKNVISKQKPKVNQTKRNKKSTLFKELKPATKALLKTISHYF